MPKIDKTAAPPTILGEDSLVYAKKEKELVAHFKPAKGAEKNLIGNIALHQWMVGRALRWQEEYLVQNKWMIGRDFTLLLRYQTQNDSTWRRLLRLLFATRKKTALAKIGFVSQIPPETATLSRISPEIPDRWAHNTCVRDPETGDFVLLKVLRDREREESLRKPT